MHNYEKQLLTTTLKKLRAEGACVGGYNKLVRGLQGKEITSEDRYRSTYIRFAHKDHINLLFILENNGVQDCLWSLKATDQNCDKTKRLIAVFCAKEVKHLMKDQRSIDALDVAERFANGLATEEERTAAATATAAAYTATAYTAAAAAAYTATAYTVATAAAAAAAAAYTATATTAAYAAARKKQAEIIKSFLLES